VIFAIALMLMVVAISMMLVRKQDYVLSISFWWVSRRFNFGNILFYLKAHQAFADNPSTVFAAMNMGVIILGVYRILVLKKNEPKKLYRTCIRVSLYCINCAVANLRLDFFFWSSFKHYSFCQVL
jgi:hypothetical protein